MQQGKLEIIKQEMERVSLTILGIGELRWTGMGFFLSDNVKVFYTGHDSHIKNGVAFLCTKEVADSVLGYNPVSDRIISLRLNGKAVNTTLVQIIRCKQ